MLRAMRSSRFLRATAAIVFLIAPDTTAQPAAVETAPPEQPEAEASACSRGKASAIAELACELRRGLGELPNGALVASGTLQCDTRLDDPAALGNRIATVVAGALGRGARATRGAAGLSRARALASAAGTLVHLRPSVEQGELRVVADVYPVPKNFWDRVRDPTPSPAAHAFASRRLDAEIRTFLPPVPLLARKVTKARSPEPQPVTLSCEDVDDNGSLELLLVGRRHIRLGRIRNAKLAVYASAEWAELSPIAQSPLREPIGSAAIAPGAHIDVGISDRARAVRLDPELGRARTVGRRVPWPDGGCSKFNGVALARKRVPCHPGDASPTWRDFGHRTDAIAAAELIGRNGRLRGFAAGRIANSDTAVLRDSEGRQARIQGVGAQLALGDVDGDGQPELVSGANTLEPKSDAMLVHTWMDDGSIRERLRLAVPTGVYALAICPPESTGAAAVAIATRGSIWIVR
jgi:hypothetical protein